MGLKRKIGVIVVDHDPDKPSLSDIVVNNRILNGPESFVKFWSETTNRFVDLSESSVLAQVSGAITGPTAEDVADQAIKAMKLSAPKGFDPLAGFDGFLILINPGLVTVPNPAFDPDKPEDPSNAKTMLTPFRAEYFPLSPPVIVVPVAEVTYSTIYHEVGHMLGPDHPRGLMIDDKDLETVIKQGPEYGSPYDIMGAWEATDKLHKPEWFKYISSYHRDKAPDWPGPLFASIGPNLSRAQLHFTWPEAFAEADVLDRPLPYQGVTIRERLTSKRILVLRADREDGVRAFRTYLELRAATGWDEGLAIAAGDSAREGVVVHQVANEVTGADGEATPRLWYRGVVRRHSPDSDVNLPRSSMTVTVTEWGADYADVEVSVHENLELVTVALTASSSTLGRELAVEERKTPCGDTYEVVTWEVDHHALYTANTLGFGGPGEFTNPEISVEWRVAGKRLIDIGARRRSIPDGAGNQHPIRFKFDHERGQVAIDCAFGKPFNVEVQAAVADRPTAVGSARLVHTGTYTSIRPEHLPAITACIVENIPVNLEWLKLRPPDPLEFGQIDWARDRELRVWTERTLTAIDHVDGLDLRRRNDLRNLIVAPIVV